MTRSTFKHLLGADEDANDSGTLGGLYAIEQRLLRMITGIFLFFVETIPDFWKKLLAWLREKLLFALRVVIRSVRVAALFIAWLAITFGPLALYASTISLIWTAIAIVGSIYGLRRELKKRAAAAPLATHVSVQAIRSSAIRG